MATILPSSSPSLSLSLHRICSSSPINHSSQHSVVFCCNAIAHSKISWRCHAHFSSLYELKGAADGKHLRICFRRTAICVAAACAGQRRPSIMEADKQLSYEEQYAADGNLETLNDQLCCQRKVLKTSMFVLMDGPLRTCLTTLRVLGVSVVVFAGFGVAAAFACDHMLQRNALAATRWQTVSVVPHLREQREENKASKNLEDPQPEMLAAVIVQRVSSMPRSKEQTLENKASKDMEGPQSKMLAALHSQTVTGASLHEQRQEVKAPEASKDPQPTFFAEGQDEDAQAKEAECAFQDWKSKSYALTVPLKIVGLRGSVPPIWLKGFLLSQGKRVRLAAQFEGSLNKIFTELSLALQKQHVIPSSPMAADVVTIGDSWLGPAIASGLLKPIDDVDRCDWFRLLDSKWQAFLRRDENGYVSSAGKVWGVPYRCGCLVIAYKKDKLLKLGIPAIKDWNDLWRPELSRKIAIVDSPREVVGTVLKSLGASYNSIDFEKDIPGGKEALLKRFREFRKQIRIFDSINYLKALGAGDVYVAVGWSADVIPFAKRASNVAVVAPESGTSLWADLWAVPAATSIKSDKVGGRIRGPSPLINQWFEFCLQPARALSFEQGAFTGASPLDLCSFVHPSSSSEELLDGRSLNIRSSLVSIKPTHLLENLGYVQKGTNKATSTPKLDTNIVAGLPPPEISSRSEFLLPLPREAIANYEWLLVNSEVGERKPHTFWTHLKTLLSLP